MNSGKATAQGGTGPALFPRPTGTPQILHGDGAPEGLVYAGQGSLYMRRDGTGANSLYTKTTGVTISTGWVLFNTSSAGTTYRKNTAKTVNNSIAETDLLNSEITIPANLLGTSGIVRLTAFGDWLNNTGGALGCGRFKLKLGSSVLFDTGAATSGFSSASASRLSWRIKSEILNTASGSQVASFEVWVAGVNNNVNGGGTFATGEGQWQFLVGASGAFPSLVGHGFTSASVDTTQAQALALTVINATASASYETKLSGALVEII